MSYFLSVRYFLRRGANEETEITGHADCRKGGADFSSRSHQGWLSVGSFHLFWPLKKHVAGKQFTTNTDFENVTPCLQTPATDFFFYTGVRTLARWRHR